MAVNAFVTFFDKADGESIQRGNEKWIEIQGWDWEIEAESSWTKGGGASVGKPKPGTMTWVHAFDTSSTVLMGYICNGKSFPKVELRVRRATGNASPESSYFTMTMESAYITRVATSGTSEGDITQSVEMVFKTVKINYKPQDSETGQLGAARAFNWDIPAGTASPSA